jgi:hypothetical protein
MPTIKYFFSSFIFLLSGTLHAQVPSDGHSITCGMQDTVDTYQAAPFSFLNGTSTLGTEFILKFSDNVPPVAEASMTFAANVWGSILQSEVPVVVEVDWQDRMTIAYSPAPALLPCFGALLDQNRKLGIQ